MSFQAYLDNIKSKTGKTAEDFKKIAKKKGLLGPEIKASAIVAWLKQDYDLGHGHAMAIYTVFKGLKEPKQDASAMENKHFAGEKEKWRSAYNVLVKKSKTFGADVKIEPVVSYISFLRGKRKFAIVQITKDRMYIGIKLKNQTATSRLEGAGTWNAMITHKVSIISSKELDKELFGWLYRAYEQNSSKKIM